jgi:nuclear transport factor 2 (NTF2) superfamily protein
MKKTIFILLSILLLNSCSKTDESYLKATMLGQDIIKIATKIEKKYNNNSQVLEVWIYHSDSIAYFYKYGFKQNSGAYYYTDLRVKYKTIRLVEQSIGTITNNNGVINGTTITPKTNGSIEFKNYQL